MIGSNILPALSAAALLGLAGFASAAETAAPAHPAPPPKATSVIDLEMCKPFEVADGAPGTHPLMIAPPGQTKIAEAALAKAQSYSDSLGGGHALLVWQGGELRYEHYGPGVTEDTRFETFSMHKSVLGLVFGAALRDGIIHSLDDRVGDYLQEWKHDPRGDITLRQLLTMESGLSLGGIDAKASVALSRTQDVPPGSRFEYSNVNPQLAGVALDRALKASGRGDYAAYLSKVLLKPLGAGDAHLWLDQEGGEPRFFAFLQMRSRDWLRVGILIDRKGRFDGQQVLPAAWIKTLTTPSALNPNYGILTWIGSPWRRYRLYGPRTTVKMSHLEPYLADDLVFFDGFGGERVYIVPSLDLVIVRIGELNPTFDDSIIPNAIIAGLQPGKPLSDQAPSAALGSNRAPAARPAL
jgi:CubicO group peptidase (beta-lactamase class C family)